MEWGWGKSKKKNSQEIINKTIPMDSGQNNIRVRGKKRFPPYMYKKNLASLIYFFILFIYFYLFSHSQNLIQHEQKLLIKL